LKKYLIEVLKDVALGFASGVGFCLLTIIVASLTILIVMSLEYITFLIKGN